MSMKKPEPPLERFEFGPFVVEVSMLSNHKDYRVWNAWFGKKGTTQRYWSSFRLDKGVWFGPMAYYVVARTVVSDLEIALAGIQVDLHKPEFPQVQQPDMYRQRLDHLIRTLDIYDEVPTILEAVNADDAHIAEVGNPAASLHNIRSYILADQVPDRVVLYATAEHQLEVACTWKMKETDSAGFPASFDQIFSGFRFGNIYSVNETITFFRMIGYYMSLEEFTKVRFIVPRHGPKDWSPYRKRSVLRRGQDYGVEDFQPGEHDL